MILVWKKKTWLLGKPWGARRWTSPKQTACSVIKESVLPIPALGVAMEKGKEKPFQMRIHFVSVCKSHFAKLAAQKTSIYKLAQFPCVRNLQSASSGGLSQAPSGGCRQDAGWAAIVWRLDWAGASLPVWPDIWPSKSVLVAGRGCGSSPQDLSTGLLMCPQTQQPAPRRGRSKREQGGSNTSCQQYPMGQAAQPCPMRERTAQDLVVVPGAAVAKYHESGGLN